MEESLTRAFIRLLESNDNLLGRLKETEEFKEIMNLPLPYGMPVDSMDFANGETILFKHMNKNLLEECLETIKTSIEILKEEIDDNEDEDIDRELENDDQLNKDLDIADRKLINIIEELKKR